MKLKPYPIKTQLVLVSSILLLGAFNTSEKSDLLLSGINKENMDTSTKPGDNFDAYVNGTWKKNTKIPDDKASYGAGYMVYEKSHEASSKGDFAAGSDEQKIGDFYEAFMDTKTRDQKGITPLLPEYKKIDAINNYTDLASYFGYANKSGSNIPFSVSVMEDLKDPTKYMLISWQGGLGLPDREYYSLEDAKSKEIQKKYVTHIEKMLQLGGIANAPDLSKKIMALETVLAAQHMKKEQTRDIVKLYNKYAIKDLNQLMPDFNWASMLQNAGILNQQNIVVAQVDYIKSLNTIIKTTPLTTWKAYLKWNTIHGSATSLNTALDNENFDFYGKTLNGIQVKQPL